MKNYRKKPVVIEAIQITEQTYNEIRIWSDGKVYPSPVLEPSEDNPSGVYWQIKTIDSIATAVSGDWICKGIQGEFYPCKPDIFSQTYEPAYAPTSGMTKQEFIDKHCIYISDRNRAEFSSDLDAVIAGSGEQLAFKFHEWVLRNVWQKHSSGEYYYKGRSWPPKEVATEKELFQIFIKSPNS